MSQKKTPDLSRRNFLKTAGSGAAGATVLVSTPALSRELDAAAAPPDHEGKELLTFVVNGQPRRILVYPRTTLAEALREQLHLTGTKIVCNRGQCGGCTVLLDGTPVYSCHMLALDAQGREVTTIEGLMEGEELHPLQQAFVDHDGLQCGFCTPGQVMAAEGLLRKHPHPTRDEALKGLSGNLCRCSAYPKIVDSVLAAGASGKEG